MLLATSFLAVASGFYGFPGWGCCWAMTVDCLTCATGKTKEEVCEEWPSTVGCSTLPSPAPTKAPTPCNPPDNLDKITCPVLAALVKNCDLVPNAEGFVTKEQTFNGMIRAGISNETPGFVAKTINDAAFANANKVNIFELNTIQERAGRNPSDGTTPEHFRSTGIRDGSKPDLDRLELFMSKAKDDKFTLLETLEAASIFDIEWPFTTRKDTSPRYGFLLPLNGFDPTALTASNDVNEDGRALLTPGCYAHMSVKTPLATKKDGTADLATLSKDPCWGALHLSIGIMHQEFGTPAGESAVLSASEMENLWLHGTYPAGFAARRQQAANAAPTSDKFTKVFNGACVGGRWITTTTVATLDGCFAEAETRQAGAGRRRKNVANPLYGAPSAATALPQVTFFTYDAGVGECAFYSGDCTGGDSRTRFDTYKIGAARKGDFLTPWSTRS